MAVLFPILVFGGFLGWVTYLSVASSRPIKRTGPGGTLPDVWQKRTSVMLHAHGDHYAVTWPYGTVWFADGYLRVGQEGILGSGAASFVFEPGMEAVLSNRLRPLYSPRLRIEVDRSAYAELYLGRDRAAVTRQLLSYGYRLASGKTDP